MGPVEEEKKIKWKREPNCRVAHLNGAEATFLSWSAEVWSSM